MIWVGKLAGGVLGLAAGGPAGAVLGVLLGHQFDRGLGARSAAGGLGERLGGDSEALRQDFMDAAFALMGHVAKADGRVSEAEIRSARVLMHGMQLSAQQVRRAIRQFRLGKSSHFPVKQTIAALSARLRGRPDLRKAFVEVQLQAQLGAGGMSSTQRAIIWDAASALGVGRVEFAQLEALIRAQQFSGAGPKPTAGGAALAAAYRTLGIGTEASDADVKRAYRRLMNQHHPDKHAARGSDGKALEEAEAKTRAVRAAYETVRTYRGMR